MKIDKWVYKKLINNTNNNSNNSFNSNDNLCNHNKNIIIVCLKINKINK